MKVLNAKNPIWGDAEHTYITLEVQFEELADLGFIPFGANPIDVESHGVEIFNDAVAGKYGTVVEFTLPVMHVENIIANIVSKINNKRDELESSGFVYNGKIFQSNQLSVIRINNTALVAITAGSNFTIKWTAADNSEMEMNAQQILEFQKALVVHADQLHEYAKSLKTLVSAAATVDEVNSVDIETGWPALTV